MSYVLVDASQIDFAVTADTLGPNDLILYSFEGKEALSTLFRFQAVFRSSRNDIPVQTLIGKSITVSVKLPEGSRHFNGILGSFTQGGTAATDSEDEVTYYHATLYPKLWKLCFSSDCKIFQHKSALDIIKAVLSSHGVAIQDKTQGAGTTERAYCVQYNETHFNFVSRLMEAEGIFYYFDHQKGSHTMILADDCGAHKKCSSVSSVEMSLSGQDGIPLHQVVEASYQAQLVSSDFQHVDFDFPWAGYKPSPLGGIALAVRSD